MTAELIDGVKIAARVREEVKEAVAKMPSSRPGDDPCGRRPWLRHLRGLKSAARASSWDPRPATSTCRRRPRRRSLPP